MLQTFPSALRLCSYRNFINKWPVIGELYVFYFISFCSISYPRKSQGIYQFFQLVTELFPFISVSRVHCRMRRQAKMKTTHIFMTPTSEKLTGHIGYGLSVSQSGRTSVRPCVRSSHFLMHVISYEPGMLGF